MNFDTPEEELLLRSLRCLVSDVPIETIPEVDWQKVILMATRHHMVPVLHAALSADSLSTNYAAKLSMLTWQRLMRAAVMLEDYSLILRRLSATGIEVMPIKGIILCQTIYPNIAQRHFEDVDLLVRPESGHMAFNTLREMGYISHPRAPGPDWHHLQPLIHPQHGTMVEIHLDVVRRSRPGWSVDEIWSRAKVMDVAGFETWIMADEDALILTALHARRSRYDRLSYLLDSALLEKKLLLNEREKGRLISLADQAGALCALAHLQEMSGRMLALNDRPYSPCDEARLWIAGRATSLRSLSEGHNRARHGPLSTLIEGLLTDSVADSLRFFVRMALPPSNFVHKGYGGGSGIAIAYIRRLLLRLGLAARQSVDILRRK